jgi:hypothetical protein
VDEGSLQTLLDDVFDQGVVFHAFTDYMRDYEVIVHCTADPRSGVRPAYLRYLFKVCVSARIETTVPEGVWERSLDDRLISYGTGVDLDGYVWGVKWHVLYPGARVVTESAPAAHWTAALGRPFHEVRVETNAHTLNLVFSELEVTEVGTDYTPVHLAPPGWPDGKIPLGD